MIASITVSAASRLRQSRLSDSSVRAPSGAPHDVEAAPAPQTSAMRTRPADELHIALLERIDVRGTNGLADAQHEIDSDDADAIGAGPDVGAGELQGVVAVPQLGDVQVDDLA